MEKGLFITTGENRYFIEYWNEIHKNIQHASSVVSKIKAFKESIRNKADKNDGDALNGENMNKY